jgi:hypothetical protein
MTESIRRPWAFANDFFRSIHRFLVNSIVRLVKHRAMNRMTVPFEENLKRKRGKGHRCNQAFHTLRILTTA